MVKEYQQVIEACTSIASLSQFQNKLNKVFVATEDPTLKKLLLPVVAKLNETFRNSSSSAASRKAQLNMLVEPYKSLHYYCNRCIQEAKPQWQVIAEKHGWAPPKIAV